MSRRIVPDSGPGDNTPGRENLRPVSWPIIPARYAAEIISAQPGTATIDRLRSP